MLGVIGLCRKEKTLKMQRQNSGWESPWIIDVVVLSPRKDTDKVQVRKIGKCTIDTGNTQGNIVSRRFVEKVLEFPKSSIHELTWAEKAGGIGVTGHKLIPEGAIYLTWYYNKSTMVFHNMRFLISEYSKIDLIIGARSCLEHGIQNVPNLMAANPGLYGRTVIGRKEKYQKDEELDKLCRTKEKWNSQKGDLEVKLAEAKIEKDKDEIEKVKEELAKVSKKSEIADKRLELCVATRHNRFELAATIQDELSELLGLAQTKLLTPTSTTSTAMSHNKEGEQEAKKRTSKQA